MRCSCDQKDNLATKIQTHDCVQKHPHNSVPIIKDRFPVTSIDIGMINGEYTEIKGARGWENTCNLIQNACPLFAGACM